MSHKFEDIQESFERSPSQLLVIKLRVFTKMIKKVFQEQIVVRVYSKSIIFTKLFFLN